MLNNAQNLRVTLEVLCVKNIVHNSIKLIA